MAFYENRQESLWGICTAHFSTREPSFAYIYTVSVSSSDRRPCVIDRTSSFFPRTLFKRRLTKLCGTLKDRYGSFFQVSFCTFGILSFCRVLCITFLHLLEVVTSLWESARDRQREANAPYGKCRLIFVGIFWKIDRCRIVSLYYIILPYHHWNLVLYYSIVSWYTIEFKCNIRIIYDPMKLLRIN